MDVASDQEPLLGDTERGVFVANQRISLKKSEVHALKGGRGIVQVLVQDPHTKMKLGMFLVSMLTIALTVVLFSAVLSVRLGWRALEKYDLRNEYAYDDLSEFISGMEACLSLTLAFLTIHICLSIMAMRCNFSTESLMIAHFLEVIFIFIFCSAMISVADSFLETVRGKGGAREGGYCKDGFNRETNPGCDDLIDGFELVRDLGAGIISIMISVGIAYTIILYKKTTLLKGDGYSKLPKPGMRVGSNEEDVDVISD